MKVYIFGNQDLESDNVAISLSKKVKKDDDIEFIYIKPNEDVPFVNEEHVVLIDVILDLKEVTVFDESSIDKLVLSPRSSVHDFDLGFQLKYLKKLGMLNKVTIIGLPMLGSIDYDSIHSILRKLVAQDIQGS